jgi:hypothetical protein
MFWIMRRQAQEPLLANHLNPELKRCQKNRVGWRTLLGSAFLLWMTTI